MPRSRSSPTCCLEDHKIRKYVKDRRTSSASRFAGDPEDRDRADPRRSEGGAVFGPAGRDHRPQGRAGRGIAGGAAEPVGRRINIKIEEINRPEIRGPTGGRGHRRAVGEAGQLPPHDEASRWNRRWRPARRGSRFSFPAGWAGRKCRGAKSKLPAPCRCRTLRAKIDYGFAEALIAQGTHWRSSVDQPRYV